MHRSVMTKVLFVACGGGSGDGCHVYCFCVSLSLFLFIPFSMIHSQWQCCDLSLFLFLSPSSLSPHSSHMTFCAAVCVVGCFVLLYPRSEEARAGLQQVNSTWCDHHPNGDDGHDHRVCPALTYQVLSVSERVCVCA